jgi:hypothetical protein
MLDIKSLICSLSHVLEPWVTLIAAEPCMMPAASWWMAGRSQLQKISKLSKKIKVIQYF